MSDMSCSNCRFWKRAPGSTDLRSPGLCVRNAPQRTVMVGNDRGRPTAVENSGWPASKFDDWCGEWSLSDAAAKRALDAAMPTQTGAPMKLLGGTGDAKN